MYIDPWKPVPKALITHAHSDHAKPGNGHYLAHTLSVPVLKYRLGQGISVTGLPYNAPILLNGVKISLHPAGHILGSAQIRLEYKGEIWVVSGDYKLQNDGLCPPFEPIRCHHFVTESTFGLPIYRFPDAQWVHEDINAWWARNKEENKTSVVIGYALGKAQRILSHLDPSIGSIFTHGAVANIQTLFSQEGIHLMETKPVLSASKEELKGGIVIAPPSAVGTPWLRRFDPYSVGICSGWMQLRGTRRREGVDRGFVLSDHADWEGLNQAVKETGAEKVYITHGYKSVFAKWLREEGRLDAIEVDTLYEGEALNEGTESEAPLANEEIR